MKGAFSEKKKKGGASHCAWRHFGTLHKLGEDEKKLLYALRLGVKRGRETSASHLSTWGERGGAFDLRENDGGLLLLREALGWQAEKGTVSKPGDVGEGSPMEKNATSPWEGCERKTFRGFERRGGGHESLSCLLPLRLEKLEKRALYRGSHRRSLGGTHSPLEKTGEAGFRRVSLSLSPCRTDATSAPEIFFLNRNKGVHQRRFKKNRLTLQKKAFRRGGRLGERGYRKSFSKRAPLL